jgi:excinuclease ABC subunit C
VIQDLKEQISRLPEQPGVYLYYNGKGETLYVGKARSLRDRTRSYLGAYGMSPRHDALLDEATRLEVIVTDSVVEALALENNLIKQRSPRYNILLRDDKNYPYLQLTTTESFPRVLVARSVERDGNIYAGPFLPAKFARRTMSLTHKVFGIRSCNEVITGMRQRPVPRIRHQAVPRAVRDDHLQRGALLGGGCRHEVISRRAQPGARRAIARPHARGVDGRAFRGSGAAARRDADGRDRARAAAEDGVGGAGRSRRLRREGRRSGAVVHVFIVRGGRVIERVEFDLGRGGERRIEGDVIEAAIQQFYSDHEPPPEIHVPVAPPDQRCARDVAGQRRSAR